MNFLKLTQTLGVRNMIVMQGGTFKIVFNTPSKIVYKHCKRTKSIHFISNRVSAATTATANDTSLASVRQKGPHPHPHIFTCQQQGTSLLLKNPIVMPQRPLYCLYVSVCYPEATGIVCA